jgi:hypothetical protein
VPQPAANTAAAEQLVEAYRRTQDNLAAQIAATFDDPTKQVAVRRLRALLADVDTQVDQLEAAIHGWLNDAMPPIWEAGGATFADAAGTTFEWTATHLQAMTAFASDRYTLALENTQFMRDETKAAIQQLARSATQRAITEGVTATQAGSELTAQVIAAVADVLPANQAGVLCVVYSNGAKVPVASWGEMNARTTTALAYNAGTTQQARDDGFDMLDVFDGPDCGWLDHLDPDLADGSVRTVEACDANPISHPNCQRAFGPHVDKAA